MNEPLAWTIVHAVAATGGLTPLPQRSPLRKAIAALTRAPEPGLLPGLLDQARLTTAQAEATQALALRVAQGVRQRSRSGGVAGLVQALLQEFALSSSEGVALMCLAEALLRIPDPVTRDALIRDKLAPGNWQQHLGRSPSLFVNAAAWGLLLTGKLVATHHEGTLATTLHGIVARGGEPLVRKCVDLAMRLLGEQFVAGQTIAQALSNARAREARGFRYSYDMLGEAALTAANAAAYGAAYEDAVHHIGRAAAGRGVIEGPGISIKLSALHPRYVRAQYGRVMAELYPRLLRLSLLARQYDIGLNIDAEESERLELSLDLLERLCFEPALAGWSGIGFVVQAYQKRCPAVVDWLIDLARRSGHRLMLRLVKGAYWDSEIKLAQLEGQSDYPVYTRKAYTDLAYLACARRLLAAPDAVYPQFATHNAYTFAAVQAMAGVNFQPRQYEFQCLHGMGEPLYEQVHDRPCRIYAPVGVHDTLLGYLVRRLLENGANSSFVNRIADPAQSLQDLVQDPVQTAQSLALQEGRVGASHPAIVLPLDLFAPTRLNSGGLDLADEGTLAHLDRALTADATQGRRAEPLLAKGRPQGPWRAVSNPADPLDEVGQVQDATPEDVLVALDAAAASAADWAATLPVERAWRLEAAATRLQADIAQLVPLLVREAGKTSASAVAEVREAVDFLRYYAAEVRRDFDNSTHRPLGPVVCISPWNFPLAIFIGQVAAALGAGNVVLAKPAEQTPLIAAAAVAALHAAGVPRGALQLLPGRGESVGATLVADARVQGVLFTGSTDVARLIHRQLSTRLSAFGEPVPLIAETGGQNTLIVDSSALLEQAVADIAASAFDSAGQRCSALRLLCVQEDVAERLLDMLRGTVQQLRVGDPRQLATDIGPLIDAEAAAAVQTHVQALKAQGCIIWRPVPDPGAAVGARGHFVQPAVIELHDIGQLDREIFGPVLHVLRYPREQLAHVLHRISATGYGLTQGVHSRIDETVAQVVAAATVGNVYVNRNIIGAVVGVQPFGGEGLSGTGPKAGGPLYLLRLLARHPARAAWRAVARSGAAAPTPLRGLAERRDEVDPHAALDLLRAWAQDQGLHRPVLQAEQAAASPAAGWRQLSGPTGESNLYTLLPRQAVLCLAEDDADRLTQLAAVLAVGSHAVWPAQAQPLYERLPPRLRVHITLAQDWRQHAVPLDAVLQHGDAAALLDTAATLADRPGPIVGLTGMAPGELRLPLERLVTERSMSINTAAAGGNASLMTLA